MRLKQLLVMAVAAAAMVLTVFVGPVHAQTGYGDDTVPPRSLTAGGNLPTAKGTNASHKSSNSAGVIIGVILAIIVIGGVLWFVLGRRNDGSATT